MTRDTGKFDVVGVGYSSWDYLSRLESLPEPDTKYEMSEFSIQGGGPAATALVALARLGASTAFVGKVSDDQFGRQMMDEFFAEGVDTSNTVVVPGKRSQFAFIMAVPKLQQRTIIWTRSDIEPLRPDEVNRDFILRGRYLHLDGHETTAAIQSARWAKEAGIPVVLDAGSVREGMDILAKEADYLIASAVFARQFTGDDDPEKAVKMLFDLGSKVSVITLGKLGSVCLSDQGLFRKPAYKVDVIDTTGAGDVFHGAFIFGLLKEWDLEEIVEFASAVAALKCRKLGGRAGIPRLGEALEFLAGHDPKWRKRAGENK